MKISIEAARLACPESKDEMHFLPLPMFVPIAEFNPANQCVGCGMSVRTEMLCDGKTNRILVNASEMFAKTFSEALTRMPLVFQSQSISVLTDTPQPTHCIVRGIKLCDGNKQRKRFGNASHLLTRDMRAARPQC